MMTDNVLLTGLNYLRRTSPIYYKQIKEEGIRISVAQTEDGKPQSRYRINASGFNAELSSSLNVKDLEERLKGHIDEVARFHRVPIFLTGPINGIHQINFI